MSKGQTNYNVKHIIMPYPLWITMKLALGHTTNLRKLHKKTQHILWLHYKLEIAACWYQMLSREINGQRKVLVINLEGQLVGRLSYRCFSLKSIRTGGETKQNFARLWKELTRQKGKMRRLTIEKKFWATV